MAKKLSDEKCAELIDTGIREFAAHGYEGANTNTIARLSGISVGALFKYYKDKEGFFLACLAHSLDILEGVLGDIDSSGGKPLGKLEELFRTLIRFSREQGDCIRMYHMITSMCDPGLTSRLAADIEGLSARVYRAYIAEMQEKGEIRRDIAPEKAAFFLDNLLMMLQFTYSCDYYKRRLSVYTGASAGDEAEDEEMIRQLLLFIDGALTAKKE